MKRIFILVTIALFTVGAVFAEEAILIDFSKLTTDIYVDPGNPGGPANGEQEPNQNKQTMVDFSAVAGGSFTTEQKQLMKTSLALPNWKVVLASSSRTVTNQSSSYTQASTSKQWGTVMGIRVHFPVEPFHSWARITTPFDIPAYDWTEVNDDGQVAEPENVDRSTPSRFEGPASADDPKKATGGYGLIKNVGSIKSIAANVYGLNFPHSLSAILIDDKGIEKVVFLGYLNYDGWGELIWNNPAYVNEVRNREMRIYPLYPASTPFVKFGGFLVQRDGAHEGGDFVAYFKDVKIIYDKAVLDTDRDIDDEAEWGIVNSRETDKKKFEMERFGQNQVLQYLENQKKAPEAGFTPTATTGENQ
ncbi:flagellar filament outer layer protein [Spirochaetia bacterium]|nr:flagellar filament outer layer protein [Spirochaetia bacterium]